MVIKSETNFWKLSPSMSRKLYDRLKLEKASLSFADHHHENTKSEVDSTFKSDRSSHRQRNFGKASEEDELVKYMSNLPGYLERAKRNREKVLNVGVLDWTRLEQWQHSHKHVPHRSSTSLTSTTNTSSSVSANRLSGRSGGGHSGYPSGQRIFHPSLRSHFMASPMQGHSQAVKSSRDSVGDCQNFRGRHSNIDTKSKYLDDHLSHRHPNSRLKGCDRKYLDPYNAKEHDIFPNDQMYEAASCARLEKTSHGRLEKRVDALREPDTGTVVQCTLRKSEPVVLRLPRDSPQNNHCRVPDTRKSIVQKSGNSSQMSFSEKPRKLSHKELNYDISHSCPLPDELSCNNSQLNGPSSTDRESFKLPASTFSSPSSTFSSPFSVQMGISPSRSRKAEERKQTMAETSSNGPLLGFYQKVTSDMSRSSSPFRRFSISMGHTSKASLCEEGENVLHLSSIATLKSGSENVRGHAGSNISGNAKPGDVSRSRSSPLRRILNPLLKPKTAKSRCSMELSQKDAVLINKNYRSANEDFSTVQPDNEVEKGHRVGFSLVNTIDSLTGKKHVPSMTRALLRIAVRNGLPLFTFAVDNNNSNILAATVKNLSALKKDECNCIYTFFTFREVKKKNGSWMNQAGRSKGPDYIPNVVAQMKVSDPHYYDLTSQNCVGSSTMKEFVLFSVNLIMQGDAQATEYQPNDELAAIVVKIPKAISFINGQHQISCQSDSQDLIHATVLLPSGVHSLPSKGGPSSLIERWKSGGSCDCGGWDLACKLKILANENQACRKPRSSKTYFEDQLELFLQGNGQEYWPAFSFTPFTHEVYAIAFDSSLSLLQAFSISLALVDCKTPELSRSRNSVEGKFPRETLLVQTEDLKAFGKLEDIPASYVSYPPHSPVGRV